MTLCSGVVLALMTLCLPGVVPIWTILCTGVVLTLMTPCTMAVSLQTGALLTLTLLEVDGHLSWRMLFTEVLAAWTLTRVWQVLDAGLRNCGVCLFFFRVVQRPTQATDCHEGP